MSALDHPSKTTLRVLAAFDTWVGVLCGRIRLLCGLWCMERGMCSVRHYLISGLFSYFVQCHICLPTMGLILLLLVVGWLILVGALLVLFWC